MKKKKSVKSTLQIELDIVKAFENMKTHLNQKSTCQEQKWTKTERKGKELIELRREVEEKDEIS